MRIGIIGTGRIANRFIAECREVEGVEISAVYNPHTGSAESFVKWLWDDEKDRPAALDNIEGLWAQIKRLSNDFAGINFNLLTLQHLT